VHVHQTAHVVLWLLDHLDLAHVHVGQRVDVAAVLLDVLGDRVWDELADHLLQVTAVHLLRNDLDHLLADVPDLES